MSITIGWMIDPSFTFQTHTSLETRPHVQTHTMLEETLACRSGVNIVTMRKLALLALLIVAGPLQAHFAYVCGMPAEIACCEGQGMDMLVSPDCEMQPDGDLSQCMELADTDADAQAARNASTSFDRGIDKTPPVLTAILPPTFELATARVGSLSPTRSPALLGTAGTQTYLVTQRLRI